MAYTKPKKLVYLAHPYRDDPQNNREDAEVWARMIHECDRSAVIVSPLQNFVYMVGTRKFIDCDAWEKEILEGCLLLLSKCDEVYVCPGWERSEGCRREMRKAFELGIPVHTVYLTPYLDKTITPDEFKKRTAIWETEK